MSPRLCFEGKAAARDDLPLEGRQELSIGRDPGNGLSYNDPWMSRFHARISRKLGHFYVEDLGSRNGTYLNGGRLRSRSLLAHGDLVTVGELELRFVVPEIDGQTEDETLPPESTVLISSEELTYDQYARPRGSSAADLLGLAVDPRKRPGPRQDSDLLPALHSVAAALITDYPLNELIEVVLELAMEAVEAERGAVLLRGRLPTMTLSKLGGVRIPQAPGAPHKSSTHTMETPMPESRGDNAAGADGADGGDDAVPRRRPPERRTATQPVRRPAGTVEREHVVGEGPGSDLELSVSRGFGEGEEVRLSRTLLKEVMSNGKAVLTLDAQADERFGEAISIQMAGIRSIFCVPLWNNREVIGVLYLDQRFSGLGFNESDLRLMGLIANMAAVKIENVYLQQEHVEKQRLEEQLAVGAKIQRHLLPSASPQIDGYDLFGSNHSCYEIGGDYFDFIPLDNGRWALVLADVAGKGVGAALLMAVLQASLRTLAHVEAEPAALVAHLNRVLVSNSPGNKFATLFYAELDPVNHQLDYVNGGHVPAGLLAVNGEVNALEPTGPVVGLVEEATFTSRRLPFPAASTLLICTDGVTELTNELGEDFGLARLRRFVQRGGVDARAMGEDLHRRLTVFCGGRHFSDDSTMLIVKRTDP